MCSTTAFARGDGYRHWFRGFEIHGHCTAVEVFVDVVVIAVVG